LRAPSRSSARERARAAARRASVDGGGRDRAPVEARRGAAGGVVRRAARGGARRSRARAHGVFALRAPQTHPQAKLKSMQAAAKDASRPEATQMIARDIAEVRASLARYGAITARWVVFQRRAT